MISGQDVKCLPQKGEENEKELGFWLGKKYWNQGYATEACEMIIDYGFYQLNLDKIWIAHFIDNHKSKRVQEKCNFKYSHTHNYYSNGLEKEVTTIVNVMTKCHCYKLGNNFDEIGVNNKK